MVITDIYVFRFIIMFPGGWAQHLMRPTHLPAAHVECHEGEQKQFLVTAAAKPINAPPQWSSGPEAMSRIHAASLRVGLVAGILFLKAVFESVAVLQ